MTDEQIVNDSSVPNAVRQRAMSIGTVGTNWLAQLNEITADLSNRWHLCVGQPLNGGTESLVLPATLQDGSLAILKIGLPTVCDAANEAHILRLANGQGYARLLNLDTKHNAILIEHLGSPLANLNKSTTEQIEVICKAMQQAWVPLETAHRFMTGAEKAQWLADFIETTWRDLGKPCSVAVRNRALDFSNERKTAFDPKKCVLVHGDAHAHNTLQTIAGDGYKFVDPDGLFAEPACDLAVPMREWSAELLAGDTLQLGLMRCEKLAALTGVNKTAIWQWGFMERVSTGLVLLQINMPELSAEYLKVAEFWAETI